MTLAGRVALVTGAGRGIGRATALALRAAGAEVVAVARSGDELAALAADCGARPLVGDLASAGGCALLADAALARWGAIDVLVNNAGVGSAGEGDVARHSFERWREAMAVNLDAPFELTRRLLPAMIDRRWGRIVMVSSLAGLPGGVAPGMSAYAASKHGLIGLMRAVAVEVAAHGVTCNAVLPGSVRTRTAELKVAEEARLAGSTVEEAWAGPRRAHDRRAPRQRRGGRRGDRVPRERGGERGQRPGARGDPLGRRDVSGRRQAGGLAQPGVLSDPGGSAPSRSVSRRSSTASQVCSMPSRVNDDTWPATIAFGSARSGSSAAGGSVSKTSRPAAAMRPRAQRVDERRLVDEAAARGVDDDGMRRQQRELARAQQMMRALAERHVQRDGVGARERVLELRQLDLEASHEVVVGRGLDGEQPAVEGPQPPGDGAADRPETDDRDRRAREVAGRRGRLPAAVAHRRAERGQSADARQQQRQRHVGDGLGVRAGRRQHGDAGGRRGIEVDRVIPDPEAHDRAQRRQPLEQRRVNSARCRRRPRRRRRARRRADRRRATSARSKRSMTSTSERPASAGAIAAPPSSPSTILRGGGALTSRPVGRPRLVLRVVVIAGGDAQVRGPHVLGGDLAHALLVAGRDHLEDRRVVADHDLAELALMHVAASEQEHVDLRAQVLPEAEQAPVRGGPVDDVVEGEIGLGRLARA